MATFVLIPGAGGQAFYWHLVVPELRRHGHDVVAVDLPAADDAAGFEQYTDCVVDAIGERTDLVVVAQSMGGFTGPMVCERVPVSLLILMNAMVPTPGDRAGNGGRTPDIASHAPNRRGATANRLMTTTRYSTRSSMILAGIARRDDAARRSPTIRYAIRCAVANGALA